MMGMRGKIIVGKPTPKNAMNKPTPQETVAYRKAMLQYFDEEDFKDMPKYVSQKLEKPISKKAIAVTN
jgi:hypothetical protein